MKEVLRTLRDLQELDEDLYRVKGELKRLPAERDKRREAVDAKRQRVTELDSDLLKLKMQVKEIEDHTKANRQRILKLERESGNTTDQALIAAYSHEIRSLRRDIAEVDDEGLKLVERIEALEGDKTALMETIKSEEEEFAEFNANVEAELAEAQAKHDKLAAERTERLGNGLPPDVQTTYEKLLEAREGMALAALEGRVCQGCFMEVPANLAVRLQRGRELVQCSNCQRILFSWD
ncbi:MAG: C4-type zinc ribbon domain-containing protein [Planctomycetota bacterium]